MNIQNPPIQNPKSPVLNIPHIFTKSPNFSVNIQNGGYCKKCGGISTWGFMDCVHPKNICKLFQRRDNKKPVLCSKEKYNSFTLWTRDIHKYIEWSPVCSPKKFIAIIESRRALNLRSNIKIPRPFIF